ncbi:diacylglycerol kinase family protein [Seonamhaeicola sediminis]|uniref:Diacylglycerol kinase family protein n=1 Tax=Seonamhaeicola sediminis TaxID=2528206 RepID=A0A562YET1_9FLAO|nr:diacylglycerol kinase family protein [Seonamhaeicola sediminis]TWO33090.1 diacylglycerol kinase family protein [Seonamhaeicola sediminis]
MSKKKESFLVNRLKSIGYAFKGAMYLIKTEASIKIQLCIAVLVTIAGFFFKISAIEWVLQCLAIAMVMSVEGINTAIEDVADFIHPEHHKKIGIIKDIAAGAVFISAFFAALIGLIIYLPKIF